MGHKKKPIFELESGTKINEKLARIPKFATSAVKESSLGQKLPNVLWEPIFDELLVLELVEPHENCVVAGLGPRLEVKYHRVSPFYAKIRV